MMKSQAGVLLAWVKIPNVAVQRDVNLQPMVGVLRIY